MSPTMDEPESIKNFRRWAEENGGYVHEALVFKRPERTVIAYRAIPSDTCVLSCPFDLAITKDLALGAVKALVWDTRPRGRDSEESINLASRFDGLNERQIMCAYIALHWILLPDNPSKKNHLKHLPYIDTLPEPSALLTPLHFTSAELALLKGTNLLGACTDRRKEWEHEWRQVRDTFVDVDRHWAEGFTWERYLTAATYLSSRAFPSSLLSPNPSRTMVSDENSYPVLLPILDCLNHARGHPVSWVVTSSPPASSSPPSNNTPTSTPTKSHFPLSVSPPLKSVLQGSSSSPPTPTTLSSSPPVFSGLHPTRDRTSSTSTLRSLVKEVNASSLHISLHLRAATLPRAEVFNNYGPKPNSELLLGYGFVLPSNPEDTIVLKLGGSENRHEIGRDASKQALADMQASASLPPPTRPIKTLSQQQTSSPPAAAAVSTTTTAPASAPSQLTSTAPSSKSKLSTITTENASEAAAGRVVVNLRGLNGMRTLWDEVEHMVLSSGEDDDQSVTSMEGGWEVTLEVCEALDEMVTHKIAALPDLGSLKKGSLSQSHSHSSHSSPSKHHPHGHGHGAHANAHLNGGGGSSGSGSASGSDRENENGTDREATDREIGRSRSDKIVIPRRKVVKARRLRDTDVRPEVRAMIYEYVKGQREVLESILEYVEIRKRAAIDRARASGLDVQEVFESDLESGSMMSGYQSRDEDE